MKKSFIVLFILFSGIYNCAVNEPFTPSFSESEEAGICTATEALDITVDKGWQGVEMSYIQNHIQRTQSAAQEASSTRNRTLEEDLNDRKWANVIKIR